MSQASMRAFEGKILLLPLERPRARSSGTSRGDETTQRPCPLANYSASSAPFMTNLAGLGYWQRQEERESRPKMMALGLQRGRLMTQGIT